MESDESMTGDDEILVSPLSDLASCTSGLLIWLEKWKRRLRRMLPSMLQVGRCWPKLLVNGPRIPTRPLGHSRSVVWLVIPREWKLRSVVLHAISTCGLIMALRIYRSTLYWNYLSQRSSPQHISGEVITVHPILLKSVRVRLPQWQM